MASLVEEIATSLVREYLKRKGLSATYATLSDEYPKHETSITNRSELARMLQIEKLLVKNKDEDKPLRTLLEVIAKYLYERSSERSSTNHSQPSARSHRAARPSSAKTKLSTKAAADGNSSQKLIVEDNLESETVFGRGKDDLIEKSVEIEERELKQTRPRTRKKQRNLNQPITSSHDDEKHHILSTQVPTDLTSGVPDDINEKQTEEQTEELLSTLSESMELNSSSAEGAQQHVTSELSEESNQQITKLPMEFEEADFVPKVEVIGDPIQFTKPEKTPAHLVDKDKKQQSDFEKSLALLKLRRRDIPKEDPIVNVLDDNSDSAVPTKLVEEVNPDASEADSNLVNDEFITKQKAQFKSAGAVISTAKPIDIQTAMELKRLVLGSASMSYSDEWKYQGFGFCDLPGLLYGIIQHKGGPCGILAAVQANFLQEMLFLDKQTENQSYLKKMAPDSRTRQRLLAAALCRVLWRAGEEKRAVLAVPCGRTIISGGGRYKSDGLTETLMLNIFDKLEDLHNCVSRFIEYFGPDGSGVIVLLYSVILSRGIEQVIDDMDSPDTSLIGQHGYCSQEMVNLVLCGKAASNVFNDAMELTSGGKTIILKGIPNRCEIGLLSLFENYGSVQVGIFLKTPKFPVWVVCSESHYSVLFCLVRELTSDWKAERRFDLFYYDGLAQQDSSIRLSIDTTNRYFEPPAEEEMVPPIELCIRTKWKDAQIDWNGTEPIL